MKEKPTILFVLQYHFTRFQGGTEEQLWLQAPELARRGWDVHYASEMNHVPVPNVLDGVTLHGLPENPSPWRGNREPLRQLMHQLQPDVVYARMFNLYTGYTLLDAPTGAVRVWATDFLNDGLLWAKLKTLADTASPFRTLRHFLRWYHISATAAKGVRKADVILVQREEQIEELRRHGLESHLFRNVLPLVPKENMQTHTGEPLVLWAASLKGHKRPGLFVELARRCRDLPYRFVMIGAIQDPKYGMMVESSVKEIPHLAYDGAVPLFEVSERFRRAHLFVNTSITEGFGTSLVHSWMHGVPVATLGWDPDGLLSRHGLGVATRNSEELEQAVRSLLADPERRRAIGAKARAYVEQEHDLKKAVDRLESLIAERGVKVTKG